MEDSKSVLPVERGYEGSLIASYLITVYREVYWQKSFDTRYSLTEQTKPCKGQLLNTEVIQVHVKKQMEFFIRGSNLSVE